MLHEPVGRGAFAEVWRATHHERPRRIVAIKIATDPQYARQLRREARRPELNHPHIVPILDCDTLDDPPYVVMPYYSGGSLAALIRHHPAGLPEDRVQAILTDVLEGLSAAHAAGLLHCDIKPHNILLTKEGRAVLADFGLAYRPPAGAGASVCQSASLERERQTLAGTLGYLAPELLDGAQPSPRSDVYGLAITLFEMLTGRRPIGPELPSQVRRDLRQSVFWDGLYWWASCAPQQRYADAGQMRAALRAGPRPAPLGAQQDVPLPRLPAPAPLPDNVWEALALRYHEYRQACQSAETVDAELAEMLKVCADHHPDVRVLRVRQSALAKHRQECLERFAQVCARIVRQLGAQIQAAETRRAALLDRGCLENHPDVVALDSQLDELRALQYQVQSLPEGAGAGPMLRDHKGRFVKKTLLPCLEAWLACREADQASSYTAFLERFGNGLSNPWARTAQARRDALAAREAKRRQILRSTSVAVVFVLLCTLYGCLLGLNGALIELAFRDSLRDQARTCIQNAMKAGDPASAVWAFLGAAPERLNRYATGRWIGVLAGVLVAIGVLAERQDRWTALGEAIAGAILGAICYAILCAAIVGALAYAIVPPTDGIHPAHAAICFAILGAIGGAIGGAPASLAVRWYRIAAWLGVAAAQFNLGWCYAKGVGVTKDPAKAVRWYRKAAEQGHARAQCKLGWCYAKGVGVTKDPAQAVRWYRMAAEQGHAVAQYNLGWCYENGVGVTKDPAEAVRWYRKAAKQGLAAAKHALESLES